ncbi:glycosyltransferase [Bacillus sp. V3B]|uniref:glycosyltransferase n=1 Tax=Bacillus sp. V3B TaxID=2804915 RepID=UPI002108F448|nr:glycosyltransferase [Bacillus sp. V3B]MCQ6275289.1 glycosyltransferase [Bacillus sp. V3B]
MKEVLVASFDMEVGGVERSLINMLESFDYSDYKVDLMLYRHQGDFMKMLPSKPNLLKEIPQYTTFRKSISETVKEGHIGIGLSRILSKMNTKFYQKRKKIAEPGYYQMQIMWKYALPFLPQMEKEYDVAISYLWPHYFVAEKVKARKKIAWIHTDYSTIETDIKLDLKMWHQFDHIIAVSEACKNAFLAKYKELESKVSVVENITSPEFIQKMGKEELDNPMESDNRLKLLTVARLSHAKGIDKAVEALKLLKDKGYDDIAWYVVGYGGDEAKIQELVRQNNLEKDFILLGKKTNPYPFMKACDLYVQPSRYEGKAVTVTEAKILAKPIIITNYSTAGSQIEKGVDGVICKDLSVESIACEIEVLYKNEDMRGKFINHNKKFDHSNDHELDKLYSLIG